MNLNLNQIKQHLLEPDLSENDIIQQLKNLNQIFTQKREKINQYAFDSKKISAYTTFYLPTNIPKLHFILNQLPENILENISNTDFIDFGTGPGTYIISFLKYFKTYNNAIWGIDKSSLMLQQAQMLTSNFFKNHSINYAKDIPNIKSGTNITLCAGHSLNEVSIDNFINLIKTINPQNIIIIEPGTKEAFKKILQVKNALCDIGFSTIYPCTDGLKKCPMENQSDNWCHQVIKMTHEKDMERLSQKIMKDRRTMPLIGHVYSKISPTKDNLTRFIRIISQTKFSFECELCKNNHIFKAQIPLKTMKKSEIKSFKKTNWGVNINYDIIKEIDKNYYKISLKLATN